MMKTFQLGLFLISALVPSIAFIFGRISLHKRHALYPRMIIDGVGCISLGEWFNFFAYLTTGDYPTGFNIGVLSIFGAFAFFLFANYGQIDSLVDDGLAHLEKYRYISGLAPILVWVSYFFISLQLESLEMKIVFAVICAGIGFADYYHLKHLILPDVDCGIARSMRLFNLFALIYSVIYMAQVFCLYKGNEILFYILIFVMTIVSALLVPLTVGGVKKWTI